MTSTTDADREPENGDPVPTELGRDGTALLIRWSDGRQQRLETETLQRQCPCATCRERYRDAEPVQADSSHAEGKRIATTLPILPLASTAAPLRIERMEPVGNYAYAIRYDRGCNKGIYTFRYLRELGGFTQR